LASLAFAFDRVGLRQVFSMTDPTNARSRAVMERCGLTLRGELEFHGFHEAWYAIDRGDWPPGGYDRPPVRILDG
jgi:RimJ/RimL family protein N-acetyltransferase